MSVLEHYRQQVALTDEAITNAEMRNRLLQALPAEPSWQQAKMWCVRDKSTLKETITLLESHKQPLLPPTTSISTEPFTTATASLARRRDKKRKED